jgi:hypothetical protein
VDSVVEDNVIISATNASDHVVRINDLNSCGAQSQDCQSGGAVIRNNTIYNTGSDANAGIRIGSSYSATGYVVTGNAVVNASGLTACYSYAGNGIQYWDYNLCNGAGSVGTPAGGWDTHSLTSAPQFTGATAPYDFTPAAGSPLVDGGSTATSCTVAGLANQACSSSLAWRSATWTPWQETPLKPRDSTPDIGAFER